MTIMKFEIVQVSMILKMAAKQVCRITFLEPALQGKEADSCEQIH